MPQFCHRTYLDRRTQLHPVMLPEWRSANVVVEALHGAEDWRDVELRTLRDELNATQWPTIDRLFDVLEARLGHRAA